MVSCVATLLLLMTMLGLAACGKPESPDSEVATEGRAGDYIYLFGYESPLDFKANEADGTDFESFGFFKIRATSSQAALRWGEALSDWYVQHLFGDPRPGRWSRGRYAAWIETGSDVPAAARSMTEIADGTYPDLATIRSLFKG